MGAGCIGLFVGGHLQYGGLKVKFAGRSVLRRTEARGRLRLTDVERPDVAIVFPVSQLDLVYDAEACECGQNKSSAVTTDRCAYVCRRSPTAT